MACRPSRKHARCNGRGSTRQASSARRRRGRWRGWDELKLLAALPPALGLVVEEGRRGPFAVDEDFGDLAHWMQQRELASLVEPDRQVDLSEHVDRLVDQRVGEL